MPICDKRFYKFQKRTEILEAEISAPKYGSAAFSLILLSHQVARQRLLPRGSWLPILAAVGLLLLMQPSSPAAVHELVFDVSPDQTFFDGGRFIYVDPNQYVNPNQPPMWAWSIVAVVRPTAINGNRTVVTNDIGDWRDDVLFGISPEENYISPEGRWAAIHQNDDDDSRTVAFAAPGIEVNTKYHIAATSDGEYLRFYVNGRPVSCPTQKLGTDLDFATDRNTYIGARSDGARPFKGHIYSVQMYNTALTDTEIQMLAAAECLLDFSNPGIQCHVDNIIVEGIQLYMVTSMDVVNGYEVITDYANIRFVYRLLGANTWEVAEAKELALDGQHSITWSDSVSPARYFVATGNCDPSGPKRGRIASFESLEDDIIYSEADTIDGILIPRPHDLEFNPEDGYFYGVTAPLSYNSPGNLYCTDANEKVLFRFKDIDPNGVAIDGGILDLGHEYSNDEFYLRSLTIVNGIVYAVNAFGPEVIRINDFEGDPNASTTTTSYLADSSFTADLQGIEFHNGWWYGTGDWRGPMLARWRSWDDFINGRWEDLSYLIYPNEKDTVVTDSVAYFLTRWNERLFFTVYHRTTPNLQDRVYEIVEPLSFSYSGRGTVGDLNCDGKVNLLDLGILANHWLQSTNG